MQQTLFILILCSFSSCFVIGQEETVMDEVVIQGKNNKENSLSLTLNSKTIENKLASDLGQVMKLFPGIQVKNYGDVGGMKTVSFRSLGAGHTALSLDYSGVSTTQSGQNDLSNIPTDFIQQVELISLSPTRVDIPIHAKLSGVVIHVETLHAYRQSNPKNILIGGSVGSFDRYEAIGMLAYQAKKVFSATATGKYRSYGGNFPFSYRNGNTTIHERRNNNRLTEYFGTGSFQLKLNEHHTLQARFSANNYDKQLAGAVVFYNSNTKQYLAGYGYTSSLNHRFQKNKFQGFTAVNFQNNQLKYLDSSYLNAIGYLDQRYHSTQFDAQTQWSYALRENINILAGSSFTMEQLFGKNLTQQPFRNSSESLLGLQIKWIEKINFLLQLGSQGIFEKRDSILNQKWYFSPASSFQFQLNTRNSIGISYRYTNRQPTFSELYYQQIGNTKLRAEKAHLAALQYNFTYAFSKGTNQLIVQPYYTYALDKILAIPTKNLFIWSIQNIGKSDAFGLELVETFQRRFGKHTVGFRLNYTFQWTRDLSNPQSVNYGDQLSYSPINTGSLELTYAWKRFNLFVLQSYLGERYALNQNIPSNLLEAYYLLDAGAAYSIVLKRHELALRFTVNNITNKQYYYINYFVMPGINFNIKLHYAF